MRFHLLRQLRGRSVLLAGLACVLVLLILWAALNWRRTAAERPLLGTWSLEGPIDVSGVSAVLCEFRADHTCRTAVVLDPRGALINSLPGRWHLSGTLVVIDYDQSVTGGPALPGQRPERAPVLSLDDDRLVFTRPADGHQVTYRRYHGGIPE